MGKTLAGEALAAMRAAIHEARFEWTDGSDEDFNAYLASAAFASLTTAGLRVVPLDSE